MRQIHKRVFVRNDKKELLIYGYKKHIESASKELDVTDSLIEPLERRLKNFSLELVEYFISNLNEYLLRKLNSLIPCFDQKR